MRFQLGSIPHDQGSRPEAEGWHRIHSPASRAGYLMAAAAGFLSFMILLAALTALSFLLGPGLDQGAPATSSPLEGAIWALLLFIPVHEFLHAAWHPHAGLSPRTVLVVWPARLHFGVYYDGCMTRARWLAMRLAPFMFLSVVPALILAFLQNGSASPPLLVFLQALLLANCLGSGGDIIAAILVLRQVPAAAQICFSGGKAYWHLIGDARPVCDPQS